MKNYKKGNYISLQEAAKYCSYSQEYLSLRARQGKLKATKIGRNWVTKKEWVKDYLSKVEDYNNYISLQEATKYCNYSQEYLSLRARWGKLKAVKIGRNWVTKKEWVEKYEVSIEDYNRKVKRIEKVKKEILPPENLPIGEFEFRPIIQPLEPSGFRPVEKIRKAASLLKLRDIRISSTGLRFAFAFTLVLVLIIITGVFFKASLKDVLKQVSPYTYIIANITDDISKGTTKIVKQSFTSVFEDLNNQVISKITTKINEDEISSAAIVYTRDTFKEYGQWLGSNLRNQTLTIQNSIHKGVQGIAEICRGPSSAIGSASHQVTKALTYPFRTVYQFVSQFRQVSLLQEDVLKEIRSNTKDLIQGVEFLKKELKGLKEEGITIKETIKEVEVSRVTRIEPVKEITREVIKIDDEALAQLRVQVTTFATWEQDIENLKEITQKLKARPTYTPASTAPIYIASQGLQVGGHGTFVSLGVSGSAGVGNLGVGGSTSLGRNSSDKLTVQATSTFQSPITINAALTVSGKLTTTTFQITSSPSAGYVLTSDASGSATWTDVSSTGGPWTLSDTNLYPDDTSYNVAIGAADAGTAKLYIAGSVGIGETTPSYELDVNGNIRATGQVRAEIAQGTTPLIVNSTTWVANLNADLLDGHDSSAFGDATLAKQDIILDRIGQETDAASMSDSLFAGQQYIADNMGVGDAGFIKCNPTETEYDTVCSVPTLDSDEPCPIWMDCDGDGKFFWNLEECDERCATCYLGSTEYTSTPDGRDQDCDGEVDELNCDASEVAYGYNASCEWVPGGTYNYVVTAQDMSTNCGPCIQYNTGSIWVRQDQITCYDVVWWKTEQRTYYQSYYYYTCKIDNYFN